MKVWPIRLGVPYPSLSGSLKQRVYFFGMGFSSVLLVIFIKALNLIPTVITGYSEVISLWVPAIVG